MWNWITWYIYMLNTIMIQRRFRDKNGKLIIVNVPDQTERLDLGMIFGHSISNITSQGGPTSVVTVSSSIQPWEEMLSIPWNDMTTITWDNLNNKIWNETLIIPWNNMTTITWDETK